MDRIQDDTIITISSASNENMSNQDANYNLEHSYDQEMATTGSDCADKEVEGSHNSGDNGNDNHVGDACPDGADGTQGESTGDINSEDLNAFEQGMKKRAFRISPNIVCWGIACPKYQIRIWQFSLCCLHGGFKRPKGNVTTPPRAPIM